MPKPLIVVIVLLVVSTVLELLMKSWFGAVANVVLIAGLVKGHEGARGAMIALSWISLIAHVALSVLGVLALFGGAGAYAIFIIATQGFGIPVAAYTIMALRRPDVQQWMYSKSTSG